MNFVRKRKASACLFLMLRFSEEEGDNYRKRGKTKDWIKRRCEKGYFNNPGQNCLDNEEQGR